MYILIENCGISRVQNKEPFIGNWNIYITSGLMFFKTVQRLFPLARRMTERHIGSVFERGDWERDVDRGGPPANESDRKEGAGRKNKGCGGERRKGRGGN